MSGGEWTLHERNMATVMLVQSLLGAVSPNFRMVSLLETETGLTVEVVLEQESDVDREEIEDFVATTELPLIR